MTSDRYFAMLDELAIHIGVDPGTLQQSQEVVVDGFAVALLHDPSEPEALILFCTVAQLPATQRQFIASALLRANLTGQTRDRVTLGLRSGRNDIVAACRVDLYEPVRALSQRMRHLSLVAHDWRLLVQFLAEQPMQLAPPAGIHQ